MLLGFLISIIPQRMKASKNAKALRKENESEVFLNRKRVKRVDKLGRSDIAVDLYDKGFDTESRDIPIASSLPLKSRTRRYSTAQSGPGLIKTVASPRISDCSPINFFFFKTLTSSSPYTDVGREAVLKKPISPYCEMGKCRGSTVH